MQFQSNAEVRLYCRKKEREKKLLGIQGQVIKAIEINLSLVYEVKSPTWFLFFSIYKLRSGLFSCSLYLIDNAMCICKSYGQGKGDNYFLVLMKDCFQKLGNKVLE